MPKGFGYLVMERNAADEFLELEDFARRKGLRFVGADIGVNIDFLFDLDDGDLLDYYNPDDSFTNNGVEFASLTSDNKNEILKALDFNYKPRGRYQIIAGVILFEDKDGESVEAQRVWDTKEGEYWNLNYKR